MPYIDQKDRDNLDPHIKELVAKLRCKPAWNVAGLLNYTITKIVISLFANCRTYHLGNSIVGALDCASHEFKRRHLDPYEDMKIQSNGDVEPFPRVECNCERCVTNRRTEEKRRANRIKDQQG